MTRRDELAARMEDAGVPAKLLQHIDRVVEHARRLAHVHGADVETAALAAQAHDVVRHVPGHELLRDAEAYGLPVDPVDRAQPVLLHGPVGAVVLPMLFGCTDPEAIVTTRYHTTGRPGMSVIEKVVFVADKVDPRKVEKRPELGEVRRLGDRDLDAAILAYLDLEQQRAVDKGWPLHPREVATRNALLIARRNRD